MANYKMLYNIFVLLNVIHTVLSCKGCINLDEHSFDKIIPRFEAVLVKFDVAFPYGDKHEEFALVANEVKDNNDIIFAEVGIKDYGEHDNEILGKKYGINSKDELPSLRLFVQGEDEPFSFEKNRIWKAEAIKKFVRDHTNVYLGLPGCLEKFDKLASKFASSENKEGVLKETQAEADKLKLEKEKTTASVYIKFMNKVIQNGDNFVLEERRRLNKILKEGKVNAAKKEELNNRANILLAFQPSKTEL